jgi:hypothetical protein
MKIRIRKLPPSGNLEGFDLHPHAFHSGEVYDVPSRLAEILILWGYAEPEMRRESRDRAADSKRGK